MANFRTDSTLASSWASALVPRPDQALGHGAKYAWQEIGAGALAVWRACCPSRLKMPVAPLPHSPPKAWTPVSGPEAAQALRRLRCAETGREHDVFPADLFPAVKQSDLAIRMALAPSSFCGRTEPGDAFRTRIALPDKNAEVLHTVPLLPDSVQGSTLVNLGLRVGGAPVDGEIQEDYPNTLFDPKTGFAAAIVVHENRHVEIAFGPMGSQGGTLAQGLRCASNILGLWPPKSFEQADKLTRMVQARLVELNAKLPPERQLSLKLSGHSMGGALATYASLRNDVPALVINPMHLGLLTRAKVGREALQRAPSLVTEVVVKGDWVADNAAARLYGWKGRSAGAIGKRYLVPAPTRQQWKESLAREPNRGDPHQHYMVAIRRHLEPPR